MGGGEGGREEGLKGLEWLDLSRNKVGNGGVEWVGKLVGREGGRLGRLDLDKNCISARGLLFIYFFLFYLFTIDNFYFILYFIFILSLLYIIINCILYILTSYFIMVYYLL